MRFKLNGVKSHCLPNFRVRSKVHHDLLARLNMLKRLKKSRDTLLDERLEVARDNDSGNTQPFEILLVVQILVGSYEYIETGVVSRS